MSSNEISLDPVAQISADAIGKPGERVFYLQGAKGEQVITLIIEKVQLQSLIVGIEQFLEEIAEQFPKLPSTNGNYEEKDMQLLLPFKPEFRVGDIGLAYDEERDLVCLIIKEIVLDKPEGEESRSVRFWCTREQLVKLAKWGAVVASRGRPICPQCLQPMEPEGHFCPKKNGHKH
jgi:uncharacterized repeat protein (TIGR03847 family)